MVGVVNVRRQGQRERERDGVTLLTVFLALLFVLPARWVFPSMGAIGRPAGILAIGLAGWWAMSRLGSDLAPVGRNAIRTAIVLYGLVFLAAYTFGYGRGLPGVEARSADRTLLATIGVLGVALVALDGCRTRSRLDTLLLRLTYFTGLLGLFGAIQFFTGYNVAQRIRPPGLVLNRDVTGIGFARDR